MKSKLLGVAAALACFAAIHPALATPLSLVDQGSITYDPNTGLQWLDLTLSTSRSYNDVSLQFGVGGDFHGYRYATGEEVGTLFIDAGITGQSIGILNADAPAVSALISLLGPLQCSSANCTMNSNPYATRGIFEDLQSQIVWPNLRWVALLEISGNSQANVVYYDQFPLDAFYSDQGNFLVCDTTCPPAPTPLPAALPLFATGLGALGLLGWRRKRKVQAAA